MSTENFAVIELTNDAARFLGERLAESNASKVPFTQEPPFIKMTYGIRGDDDTIVGGIVAVLYCWRCLAIEMLWVDEKYQQQGLGSALLETVESEARKNGCALAHLDTFDFQAMDFYRKRGYEVFGVLPNCPPGHERFYLRKEL